MDIYEYLNCKKTGCFNEKLFSLIDKSGKKDSDIYKRADIDRKLFSKIRCSSDYIPRKNIIIKLCLALKLDKETFNDLLRTAGYALSSSKFDLVVAYCLDNKVYDLKEVNEYLYQVCNASL